MANKNVSSSATKGMPGEHVSKILEWETYMGPLNDPTILQSHHEAVSPWTIFDLPSEVLQTHIFRYLTDMDIYNLGMIGNNRSKEISEDYVQLGKPLINGVYEYDTVYQTLKIIKQIQIFTLIG